MMSNSNHLSLNMYWGRKAVQYVNNIKLLSYTGEYTKINKRQGYLYRNNMCEEIDEWDEYLIRKERLEKADKCLSTLRNEQSHFNSFNPPLPGIPFNIQEINARALIYGCGNCMEMAAVAFVFLADKIRPIDYMECQLNDHGFLVIGRSFESLENDYMTWGQSAVVCDPWHKNGEVYPCWKIPIRFYEYDGIFMPISLARVDC